MLTKRYPQSVRYVVVAWLTLWCHFSFSSLSLADIERGTKIQFDNGFSLHQQPVPGGIAVIDLNAADASSTQTPTVLWQQKNIAVLASRDRWFAIVGVPLDIAEGVHWLSVFDTDGEQRQISFNVTAHDYPLQKLQIANEDLVTPPASLATRLQIDRRQMLEARNAWRDDFNAANFQLPVDGRISSIFGLQRLFNNKRRSRHLGLDIAVPTGVPVFASHAGIISEVGDYHFNGKTVFIDHGLGLVGLYSHLSKILVRPGEYVIAGQTVGLVGATGRVTGPHLHWGVALNGTWIDPQLLVIE